MKGRNYPGKIILFGEYTVIDGGEVLAIPTSFIGAKWTFIPNVTDPDNSLITFAKYLENLDPSYLNVSQFIVDLHNGMILQSNIPLGYGAGSSGALVAATFDRYKVLEDQFTLGELKNIFSEMESFFHGKSSGIDPLVSYFNQPMRIGQSGIEFLDNDYRALLQNFYLIDSEKPKVTAKYVQLFRQNMKDEYFRTEIRSLSQLVSQAIDSLVIDHNESALTVQMNKISEIQWKNFSSMIPSKIKNFWKTTLKQKDVSVKLCGSGGGGYFLVYTYNPENLDFDCIPII